MNEKEEEKEFIIRLSTTRMQECDTEIEKHALTAPGTVTVGRDSVTINYTEKETGVRNTLRISRSRVDITRRGKTRQAMCLCLGERTLSGYDTGHGVLPMELECTRIHNFLSENGGYARFAYNMSLGSVSSARVKSFHEAEIKLEHIPSENSVK